MTSEAELNTRPRALSSLDEHRSIGSGMSPIHAQRFTQRTTSTAEFRTQPHSQGSQPEAPDALDVGRVDAARVRDHRRPDLPAPRRSAQAHRGIPFATARRAVAMRGLRPRTGAYLTDSLVVRKILTRLNLPTELPPLAPARAPARASCTARTTWPRNRASPASCASARRHPSGLSRRSHRGSRRSARSRRLRRGYRAR